MTHVALTWFVALALGAADAPPAERVLDAETWARPRNGENILALAPVADTVRAWMGDPVRRIEIEYVAGEAGLLWAQELAGWLVALGVPSDRIVLRGTGRDATVLVLRVVP
ncbi:MAG TPA: hypothetical protein VNL72_02815 [Gammaproteobacteria bacterium]|nr:hypothetical protein [Gammaproteobacteria bacterium]